MVSLDKSSEKLCLLNYYAIELLYSIGNLEPTQKEISKIKHSLKNLKNGSLSNSLLKNLVCKKPLSKRKG